MKKHQRKLLAICIITALTACSQQDTPQSSSAANDAQAPAQVNEVPPQTLAPAASAPMIDFVHGYLVEAAKQGLQPSNEFNLPAVWLFSADGYLVKQLIDVRDVTDLPLAWPQAEPNAVPLSVVETAWAQASQSPLPFDQYRAEGRGLALVLIPNASGASCEQVCEEKLAAFATLAQHALNPELVAVSLTD